LEDFSSEEEKFEQWRYKIIVKYFLVVYPHFFAKVDNNVDNLCF